MGHSGQAHQQPPQPLRREARPAPDLVRMLRCHCRLGRPAGGIGRHALSPQGFPFPSGSEMGFHVRGPQDFPKYLFLSFLLPIPAWCQIS